MPHRKGYYHAHLSRGYAQFEQSSQVNLKTGWQRLLEWLETRPMSGIDEGYEYETQVWAILVLGRYLRAAKAHNFLFLIFL